MAWSLDRLGRSLQHLLSLLAELEAKRVDLYIDGQGVEDTITPGGRALFQMMGVFAEFERAMIQSACAPVSPGRLPRMPSSAGRVCPPVSVGTAHRVLAG